MSEKGYYKYTMTDAAIWLTCYVYIFAILTYLTTVNQCLTIFFPKIMSLKRSPLDETKKHQTIEKVEGSKIPKVNLIL